MNYMASSYGNATYFYPDNSGYAGGFTKTIEAQTLVTLDYSQTLNTGVTVAKVAFLLDVQTNPQLIISGMKIVGQTNIVEFIVSGGYSGVQHQLSIVATLSDTTVRTDIVKISIAGDSSDCDPCGKTTMLMPIPPGYQQASLAQNGVYASSFVRYFVSDKTPLGANIMDQWYNTNTGALFEYITNGVHSYWFNPGIAPVVPSGPSSSLYYIATDLQAIFETTVPDQFGLTYVLDDTVTTLVYVNGVLYMPSDIGDYIVDLVNSAIVFNIPLTDNDIVTIRIASA